MIALEHKNTNPSQRPYSITAVPWVCPGCHAFSHGSEWIEKTNLVLEGGICTGKVLCDALLGESGMCGSHWKRDGVSKPWRNASFKIGNPVTRDRSSISGRVNGQWRPPFTSSTTTPSYNLTNGLRKFFFALSRCPCSWPTLVWKHERPWRHALCGVSPLRDSLDIDLIVNQL